MTAKEYLSQARYLDEIINSRMRELEYWKRLAGSISGTRLDGMPHNPNHPTEATFARCMDKIDEIEREINARVSEMVELRGEINAAIDAMGYSREQLLLRCRYLDGLPWEDICSVMKVSPRSVHRIHETALEKFNIPN